MSEKLKNLLLSILPVVFTGVICSYFTRQGVQGWYSQMLTSELTPPNYIFSFAWSLIYLLLMISFYRILSTPHQLRSKAILLFTEQLFIQILWCVLFFYFKQPLLGAIIMLWLIYTVFLMIRIFLQINVIAGTLNYFYFLYICFATFLNFAFLYYNGYIVNI